MALRFDASVQEFVRTLAPAPRQAIREALRMIEEDPYHDRLDWKLLRVDGETRFLRARVLRHYRIIYTPAAKATYIHRVQHRKEGYGWLERMDPDVRE